MWNEPTQEQLAALPRLYETEEVPLADKIMAMHFFLGGCDWWIVEFDGEGLLWGYAVLNGDLENGEWGLHQPIGVACPQSPPRHRGGL